MKIALVTEIPAPFRISPWNALAARPNVELCVFLLAERDPRRGYELHRDEWRFDSHVLGGHGLVRGRRWIVASRGIGRALASFRPDLVIVGGWNQPAFLQAVRYASRRGTPYVLWVESTARDLRLRGLGLEALKRRLLAGAAGVIVPGRAAAEYVGDLGVDSSRITVAPNTFDLDRFRRGLEARRVERDERRHGLGLTRCTFLSVSRLSREKGTDVLVRAFADVQADLVVVGDGPERRAVERLAGPNVRFLGRVGRDELPAWYVAADAFALASRSETWGMAVGEAAAAGLPLVVTDVVGAGWDLVDPGVNGYRVPSGDEGRLAEALRRVATDAAFRQRAAAHSRALVAGATPETWAASVGELAARVVA
jgi:1,2-diacylglycerol 3-alpha-glucosyltransferase